MKSTDKKRSLEEYLSLQEEAMEHSNVPNYWIGNPRRWLWLKYRKQEPITRKIRIALIYYLFIVFLVLVGLPFIGGSIQTDIALALALVVGPCAIYVGLLLAKAVVKVHDDLLALKKQKATKESDRHQDGT